MHGVSFVKPGPGKNELYLEGILGEQKKIKARIKELQLTEHKIMLKPVK